MSYQTLELKMDGAIAWLSVHRPQAMNALNAQVVQEIGEAVQSLKSNSNLRCLVITGSGEKAFVAGADIKEMQSMSSKDGQAMAERGQKVFQAIEDLPFPVIAAVNGFALGGGLELALACDFIIASKTAKMGAPEVSLGLICGYGGTQRLARFVGKSLAKMITLTGDIYSAEQMEKWGVVALVTEPSELINTVKKIADKISSRSPVALRCTKLAIRDGVEQSQEGGLRIEADLFQKAFQSEDKMEGVAAFVEKRTPQFKGR